LYVEVARLWSDEGTVERSLQAWEKAASIEEEKAEDEEEDEQEEEVKVDSQEDDEKKDQKDKKDPVDPRIRNNLGVQHFNRRPLNSTASDSHLTQAVDQFQLALLALSKRPEGLETTENDAVLTVLTFNAGAAYEALGEREKAKAAWEQVLRGHPEFVEGASLQLFLSLSLSSREERGLIIPIQLHAQRKPVSPSSSSRSATVPPSTPPTSSSKKRSLPSRTLPNSAPSTPTSSSRPASPNSVENSLGRRSRKSAVMTSMPSALPERYTTTTRGRTNPLPKKPSRTARKNSPVPPSSSKRRFSCLLNAPSQLKDSPSLSLKERWGTDRRTLPSSLERGDRLRRH
jgi:hypothetical protein